MVKDVKGSPFFVEISGACDLNNTTAEGKGLKNNKNKSDETTSFKVFPKNSKNNKCYPPLNKKI